MRYAFLVLCALLAGCDKPQNPDDFNTSDLTLPDGKVIKVETMVSATDLRVGMRYRTSLAPDHGMLFVHATSGIYPYWMYHVVIPLDIVWLDSDRKIVLIVANAQPCKSEVVQQCPEYASPQPAHYVLELEGGMAKKYNLRVGQQLAW